jgi:hypothetical protein
VVGMRFGGEGSRTSWPEFRQLGAYRYLANSARLAVNTSLCSELP